MKKYIGVKLVEATPATRYSGDGYTNFVYPDGWPMEKKTYNEYVANATLKEPGYRVVYPDGYKSWSPKDVFEEAYRETDGLTFGLALEAVKKGFKISRTGWNGKGMFVVYQKGYPQGIPCNKQTAVAWGISEGELFKCEPYLQIKMVNGSHSMWVPSINDVLAEDWGIVEE